MRPTPTATLLLSFPLLGALAAPAAGQEGGGADPSRAVVAPDAPDAGAPDGAVAAGLAPEAAGHPDPALPDRVRIAVAGSEPFVIPGEGDGPPTGLSVDIWAEVARELELDYELVPVPSAAAAVDRVAAGDFDGAIGPISITADRAARVDFTQPYWQASLSILTRAESGTWERIRPFLSRAFLSGVLILLAILTAIGCLLWLLERRPNDGFPMHPVRGIGTGIWLALVTMTTVGYGDKAPVTLAGRIVTGIWMVIALLTASSLTAGIATALTLVSLDVASIETARELADRQVAVVEGTTGVAFAQRFGARVRPTRDLAAAVAALQADDVDAVVFDRPILQYTLRQSPVEGLTLTEREYEPAGYGFIFALDAEGVSHAVDVALLELGERGRIEELGASYL